METRRRGDPYGLARRMENLARGHQQDRKEQQQRDFPREVMQIGGGKSLRNVARRVGRLQLGGADLGRCAARGTEPAHLRLNGEKGCQEAEHGARCG
jgi:hypothetical protein